MNQYEAMFLFDPTFASSYENCEAEIRRLMERAQGEIILCGKWDERRLAFPIKGRKRGVYVLTYFKAPTDKIRSLERDARISEAILRLLVLRADDLTRDSMERAYPGRVDQSAGSEHDERQKEDTPKSGEAAQSASRPAGERDRIAAATKVVAAEAVVAGEDAGGRKDSERE